jgi:hypothetical protein
MSIMPIEAYAWRGGRDGGGRGWGPWGWVGAGVASALVAGAVVASLPPRVVAVPVNGRTYYYDGVYYYLPNVAGQYIVVPPPIVAQPMIMQPQVVVPEQAVQVQAVPAQATQQAPQPTIADLEKRIAELEKAKK